MRRAGRPPRSWGTGRGCGRAGWRRPARRRRSRRSTAPGGSAAWPPSGSPVQRVVAPPVFLVRVRGVLPPAGVLADLRVPGAVTQLLDVEPFVGKGTGQLLRAAE